jgi:hypothetical protein
MVGRDVLIGMALWVAARVVLELAWLARKALDSESAGLDTNAKWCENVGEPSCISIRPNS